MICVGCSWAPEAGEEILGVPSLPVVKLMPSLTVAQQLVYR